jgi:hypothetical protein
VNNDGSNSERLKSLMSQLASNERVSELFILEENLNFLKAAVSAEFEISNLI